MLWLTKIMYSYAQSLHTNFDILFTHNDNVDNLYYKKCNVLPI